MNKEYIEVKIPILDDVKELEVVKTFNQEQLWYVCAIAKAYEKLEQENAELKNWKELHSSSALAEENIRIWKTVEELKKENEILDTKLGKYIEQKDEWVELMNKFKKQQNEFISWLESYIIELQNKDVFEYYKDGALAASKCISRKYKEIIKYE